MEFLLTTLLLLGTISTVVDISPVLKAVDISNSKGLFAGVFLIESRIGVMQIRREMAKFYSAEKIIVIPEHCDAEKITSSSV